MVKLLLNLIKNSIIDSLSIRRKPRVIQLPVTSRCNSRCVTCNVWKHKDNIDIEPTELKRIFSQSYFNKVTSVGVNGGELTLVPNILEIIDAVLTLPSLQYIYVISNGLLPDKLLEVLEQIKQRVNSKNVKLSLQLSVDGIGEIHEITRGVPNCFPRTLKILSAIQSDQSKYCDLFSIGCTISRSNVPYLRQVTEFFKQYPFEVYYHLAVPNKRIHTFNDSRYSVLNDERSRLLAEEFFFERMNSVSGRKNISDKFRYFASYYYLKNQGKGRLCECGYRLRDITIDENLNAYLCATASDTIGNIKEAPIKSLLHSTTGKKALRGVKSECDSCIHYSSTPTLKGLWIFGKYLITKRLRSRIFPKK